METLPILGFREWKARLRKVGCGKIPAKLRRNWRQWKLICTRLWVWLHWGSWSWHESYNWKAGEGGLVSIVASIFKGLYLWLSSVSCQHSSCISMLTIVFFCFDVLWLKSYKIHCLMPLCKVLFSTSQSKDSELNYWNDRTPSLTQTSKLVFPASL